MTDNDWVARAVALAGLGLGALNYWRARDRDELKLRINAHWERGTLRQVDGTGAGTNWIAIEVVNASTFTVTIQSVGFLDSRGEFLGEPYSSKDQFPQSLGARTSAGTRIGLRWIRDDYMRKIDGVCAVTATGETVRLGGKEWRELKPRLNDIQPSEATM